LNKKILLVVFSFILIFYSCGTKPSAPLSQIDAKSRINTVSFIAVGDNLFHDSVIRSSLNVETGEYDFFPIYTEIKSIVSNADLAFINQETVMAGVQFGYSGYPAFNTPQSLAPALADAGFDIFNLANNHAMDKGASGLIATLDYLDTIKNITVIGARKEGAHARIITKNNISFGFLAYTHSLNGIPLPRDNPNIVSMINKTKMTEEISNLRLLCDFLIISIHWGDEYKLEPGKDQTDLALFLAEQNVDLIIGHHPHVLQRVETIVLPDGRKTLCYYSLGNFASHQRERERIIGGMAVITFTKSKDGEPSISEFGIMPLITHYDKSFNNTKIYPFFAYTEELLAEHGLKNFGEGLSMDFFYGVTKRLNTKIIMSDPFVK
jgi:poly-gamma-glutamate synthesis protein (capsule biosynthesis protein)